MHNANNSTYTNHENHSPRPSNTNLHESDDAKYLDFIDIDLQKKYKENARYINPTQSGMIKGILFGTLIGGGFTIGIRNGAIYSLISPIIIYLGFT